MKTGWLAVAFAAAALVAADPALARPRKAPPPRPQCVDRPVEFSWLGILTNEKPTANGCAPAVNEYGQYFGQDPVPNIRAQLRRQPQTGDESPLGR